jgi:hypothetical protein
MESASASAGTHTYVTSAAFELDYYHRSLQLGLIDAFTVGTGLQGLAFTISDGGTALFSRTFASGAEAQAFFTDNVLRLPTLPVQHDDHELLLSTSFTFAGPGAFSFGYALGLSPVPEPGTWMLLLAGMTVVLAWRQRPRRQA